MSDEPHPPQGSDPVTLPDPAPRPASTLRARTTRIVSAFGPGGWARRSAKLWGFLAFTLLVIFLARHVILPFVFGLLLAYILAPVVRWLSLKKDGRPRMPKGLAIILCYIVLLAVIGLFLGALLPRLSKDIARVGREAPTLYAKLIDTWTPQVAGWLETNFPSLRHTQPPLPEATPPVDPMLPPGTQLVATPLADGRLAIQLEATGLEITKLGPSGVTVSPRKEAAEAMSLEDKLRGLTRESVIGLQTELGSVFRFGQQVIKALIRGVFTFFLVLMIGAFILLDLSRLNTFVRGLIPANYHADYEVIVAGSDRGLSGVIRGQLLICLVNGVLTYIGLLVFGVKYALLLTSVAAVLSLIPIFGSILSTIPIVLAALVSGDTGLEIARGFGILGWIIAIHLLEANYLNPRIIGTAAKIHPVLVVFALVLGEHSYGLTGALLAVPVASIVQVLFIFFRDKAWRADTAPSGAT